MSNDSGVILIYVTFPDLTEAKALARKMVSKKLAACANILPQMVSVYEWEGKLEEGNEVVAIFKTRKSLQQELVREIGMSHSYSTPAVLAIPVLSGHPDFVKWVEDQTASSI